ncbi:MAG: formimidoylglutamate deiminase [Pseudomonadota bacterium]
MIRIFAAQALLPSGWADDVTLEIAEDGRIGRVDVQLPPERSAPVDHTVGILLPAPVNAHSHAFQRAMAGLTERRGPDPSDSFWSWRQLMYRFLDQLDPDQVEAITAIVQMEMLEAGYAINVEFHYLHHQPGGTPYDNLAEMSERIIAAADQTGIGLTLLPVHYQYGGCDRRDLGAGQVRFGNTDDRFQRLFESASRAMRQLGSDSCLGLAPHSLRAVAPESLPRLAALAAGRPIHMHLAEQVAEVEEVQSAWGKRPVEWLLDTIDVNGQWCLVHCTQMLEHETVALARSGAVACLCPITESNLGDGIFDGVRWFQNGGNAAVGSDSNIRISLAEELRTLEYSQRLRDKSRAALATPDKSTGRRIFEAVVAGGAQAAGRGKAGIVSGGWADLFSLDPDTADLSGRTGDTILDCFAFAGGNRMVKDVWSAGRHCVKDGRHPARQQIIERYKSTLTQLGDSL